ncbi:response regulator [Nocardioides sp. GXQ0305]|uniref:response regulator n=1 Tax=Nocardioides sp. GXQ0305 TaxID=3423912 RepID=UPI003D7E5A12
MRTSVLLVDDSPTFVDRARATLERGDLEVVGTADTGVAALAEAVRLQPAAILVDVQLGPESGFDVVRRMAQDERLQNSTLILMSTCHEDELRDLLDATPASAFLHKLDLTPSRVLEVRQRAEGRAG